MQQQLEPQHQQPENIDDIYNNIPQSIIASFQTHLTEYQMNDDLQIDISTDLDEESLNKIVKQLLESTLDKQSIEKVNFDFLVNGKLLRGKLKSHLVRYEIICEQVVEIEYFVAFREFQHMKETPVQDWISSICEVMGVDSNIGVISSLFDGSVTFNEKSGKKESKTKHKIHDAPIKSIKCLPSEKEEVYYVISGGIDEELRVSKFGLQTPFEIISINPHEGSVLALDFNPGLDGHVCTAGALGILNIWKIPQNFLDSNQMEVKTEKKKKKKTNTKNLPFVTSYHLHKETVNSMSWLNTDIVATGSADHSIKLLDITRMRQGRTFLTKDSITTGIDYSNNVIFSSHQDGYIRTWDIRESSSNPSQTFKSHSRFASSVRTSPHSNTFATSSYDGTVKIWDTRSVFPLQTIATNYDKVFAICWKSQHELVSGGSNPYLTFHSV